ncbi:MAG: RagB/SusD family nutrient uptake outer membrane protein [Bacteroidales bacterium]|jgi:tetratricopeptide (TPR) repeat protein|nr:RagB/SusD family nutrient uptake outer membrane protein [Bacteroidales bacterium]
MKKILSIISISAIFLVLTSSCEEKLDITPQGSIDKTALQNETGVELLVTSAYAALTEGEGRGEGGALNNWILSSMPGGDCNKGSDPGDGMPLSLNEFEQYQVLTTNASVDWKWVLNMRAIKRINNAINLINSVENISATLKSKRLGEMKFLRALFYFEQRRVFGNVPYIDEEIEATQNNPKVRNNVEILPFIEEDLLEAVELLPDKQDHPGRANKWAAKSLLAKVYMFEEKFTEAVPVLKDIIDNGVNSKGVKYQLLQNYSDNFSIATENNTETVFAIQHSTDAVQSNAHVGMQRATLYGTAMYGAGWGFCQPSYCLVNSFQVDANGLPKLDGSYMDALIPNVDIREASDANDADRTIPVDPRLDHTVTRRGIPFYDWGMPKSNWVRNFTNGGPFMPRKNLHKKSDTFYVTRGSALNWNLIRFADVILWYAEALAETDRFVEAREYVNMIRERAANDLVMFGEQPAANYVVGLYPESNFDTKEEAILAIRFENKLEFGMEGHRFFDLQRWGYPVAKAEIDFYVNHEKLYISKFATASPFAEYMMYYPIPQTQIQTLGNDENGEPYLVQNPGY